MPDSLNAKGTDKASREAAKIGKEKWKQKQEKLKSKYEASKKNADEMQQLVDDKYEKYGGDMVKRALTAEKMKGRKQVWETEAGLLKDNPKAAAKLKQQIASINGRLNDEEAALKGLEPSKEEQDTQMKAAKDKIAQDDALKKEQEAEEDRLASRKREKDAADTRSQSRAEERGEREGQGEEIKQVDTTTTAQTEPSGDEGEGLSKEAAQKKIDKAKEVYDGVSDENKLEKLRAKMTFLQAKQGLETIKKKEGDKDAGEKIQAFGDEIGEVMKEIAAEKGDKPEKYVNDLEDTAKEEKPEKNSKDDMLQRLETLLDKEQSKGDDANDAKVKKIQGMISKLSAKESWQIDNTVLGNLFEREIKALENTDSLNESKYINLSIKDKFSKLLINWKEIKGSEL